MKNTLDLEYSHTFKNSITKKIVLLINVNMPTIVTFPLILTNLILMSSLNFILNSIEDENKFYNLEARLVVCDLY